MTQSQQGTARKYFRPDGTMYYPKGADAESIRHARKMKRLEVRPPIGRVDGVSGYNMGGRASAYGAYGRECEQGGGDGRLVLSRESQLFTLMRHFHRI